MDYGFDSSSGKRRALRRNDKFNDLRQQKRLQKTLTPTLNPEEPIKKAGRWIDIQSPARTITQPIILSKVPYPLPNTL
jgi:hypothetical protein